jgi:ABC-type multidrug transport system, ATPase and permease components
MVITSIIEASVAVSRLTSYLTAEEIQPEAVIVKPPVEQIGEETVRIEDGTFSWNRHENKTVLKDINFKAAKGELTCIVGRVGAGKSSFLQSILGDLWKVKGRVEVHGTVAYASQSPWIMNATVRENIVFGYRFDAEFYEKTVKACALLDDFAQLPDGDETVVGERGISLSGGQKARVALARAVYARADVYLLDDVLSAVDSHVGRHIIDNVLGPRGLLKSKTRVLATNSIPVLVESDYICMLKDGEIVERGTYNELLSNKGLVFDLVKTAGKGDSTQNSGSATPRESESETSTVIEASSNGQDKDDLEEAQEGLSALQSIRPGPSSSQSKPRADSMATLRRASAASFNGPRGKLHDEENPNSRTKQAKEHSEQGKVKWSGMFSPTHHNSRSVTEIATVYAEYAKTNNLVAVAFYLFALIAAQTANIGKLIPAILSRCGRIRSDVA